MRALAAETLGTALLLAAIVGSGIMAEQLSQGNVALALLCNSLATGAALTVLITVFAPVSGAHFNPAVTLAFLARGAIAPDAALARIACQLAGAVLGTWVAHLMFALPVLEVATHARAEPNLWLSESVATFGLLLTIFGTMRAKPDALPLSVGLYIVAAYWFTASTSFANPAVTVARSLTDTFSGIDPAGALPFIIAQLIGALVAAGLSAWLFQATSSPETLSH